MTIDVNGSVFLNYYKEDCLPEYIQFNEVKYHFDIKHSDIKSLKGCPLKCMYFNIQHCDNLTNLKDLTDSEFVNIGLGYCKNLTSLIGPKKYNELVIIECPIKDLKGVPSKINRISISNCDKLKSLKGSPKSVHQFHCEHCSSLETLDGAPEVIYDFSCKGCSNLTSLEGLGTVIMDLIAVDCGKTFTRKYFDKLGIKTGSNFTLYNKKRKNGQVYNG